MPSEEKPANISKEEAFKRLFRDDFVGNIVAGLVNLLFTRQTVIGVLMGVAIVLAIFAFREIDRNHKISQEADAVFQEKLDVIEIRLNRLEKTQR